ncbi:MAG: hypothetical protein JNM84_07100 [Planctomycetes bacterium]|nr:hypothetical protein [Planctomycetota bacterium]
MSSSPSGGDRRAQWIAIAAALVFLGAWLFYAFSLDARADATIAGNDAIPYALALEDEDPARILDPHHPLFHVLSWGVVRVLRAVQPDLEMPGTWALKLVSAAGGALALALLFRAVARGSTFLVAALLVAAAGSTAGFRLYASVGETYWPALAAQLALLLHCLDAERERRPLELRALVGWTVLALLLRQDALLVVPCVAAMLAADRGRPSPSARWRDAASYLALCGALTIAGYGACYGVYALQAAAPVGPLDWLTKLAQTGKWGGFGGLDPVWSTHATHPSALRLSLDLTAASWDYGTLPWLRGAAAGPESAGALHGAALALALVVVIAPAIARPSRAVVAIAALFLMPRLAFYAWWQPGNTEYHSGHWIAYLAVAALGLARWHAARGIAVRAIAPFALAIALALTAPSNERSLLAPLREPTLARRALQVGLWYAEGRRIVSVDPLMSYALERFGPIPHLELHPPAVAPSELDAWARTEVLRLGEGVADGFAFVRDTSLASAFGTPPWSVDHLIAFTGALLASPHAQGLGAPIFEPPDGAREDAWALRIEPRR